jgi:hypothetical protein
MVFRVWLFSTKDATGRQKQKDRDTPSNDLQMPNAVGNNLIRAQAKVTDRASPMLPHLSAERVLRAWICFVSVVSNESVPANESMKPTPPACRLPCRGTSNSPIKTMASRDGGERALRCL